MATEVMTAPEGRIIHKTYAVLSGAAMPQRVHVTQYDESLPVIACTLYKDGQLYTIPDGASVRLRMNKNGLPVYHEAIGIDDARHVVYLEITAQMTVLYGEFAMVLEVETSDGKTAGTSYLRLIVRQNPVQNPDLDNIPDYTANSNRLTAEGVKKLQDESSTQQKAIEDKGKSTLESIPADYSTLIGKVNKNTNGISVLKEDLESGYKYLDIPIPFVPGSFNTTGTTIVSNPKRACCKFTPPIDCMAKNSEEYWFYVQKKVDDNIITLKSWSTPSYTFEANTEYIVSVKGFDDSDLTDKLDDIRKNIYAYTNENTGLLNEKVSALKYTKIYNSIDSMIKDSSIKIDDVCETLKHSVVDGKGGARYYIVDKVDIDDVYVELDNGLYAKMDLIHNINPYQFGCYGDGVHNDSLKLQNFLDASCDSKHIITEGIYRISSPLKCNHDIILECKGTIYDVSKPDINTTIIAFVDDIGIEYDITFTLNKDVYSFDLSDTSRISIGDIIEIYTDTADEYNYKGGIITTVVNVTSNKVYISDAPSKNLDVSMFKVFKPITVNINGLSFSCGNSNGYYTFLSCRHIKNSTISNIVVNGNGDICGVEFLGCLNSDVKKCNISGCYDKNNIGNNLRTGYGISVTGCNITAEKNVITNCKHCITSASRKYISKNIVFIKNELYIHSNLPQEQLLSLLDFHGNVNNGRICENIIRILYNDGSYKNPQVISIRGKKIIVSKNIIELGGFDECRFIMYENASNVIFIANNGLININAQTPVDNVIISCNELKSITENGNNWVIQTNLIS